MTKKDTERAEATSELRKILRPKQTVYCILRHCSASGMSRVIDLCVIAPNRETAYPKNADGSTNWEGKPRKLLRGYYIRSISHLAARAMGDKVDSKHDGIKIGGCGMDMGFALVYNWGRTVWPKGTPKPHGRRNGEPDSCGGYALKHSWL